MTTKTRTPKRERHGQLMIWGVTPRVRNRFKAACASKGITMRDAIIRMITRFADEALRQ